VTKPTELDKNLSKVVGVARPSKETFVADSTTLFVILLEFVLLNIADSFHNDTNAETDDGQDISGFVEGRLRVAVDNRAIKHSHRHTDCPDLDIGIISNLQHAKGHDHPPRVFGRNRSPTSARPFHACHQSDRPFLS
jgi:hypothetical protein